VGKKYLSHLACLLVRILCAAKVSYPDMHPSSRLEYEPKSCTIWCDYFCPRPWCWIQGWRHEIE